MVIHVKAKASELKFATWRAADNCIEKYTEYSVNCETLRRSLGIFNNTYELRIKGTEDAINSFLSFLKMKGFKINKF